MQVVWQVEHCGLGNMFYCREKVTNVKKKTKQKKKQKQKCLGMMLTAYSFAFSFIKSVVAADSERSACFWLKEARLA